MKKFLALLCAVWVALVPGLSLAQTPATTDSDPVSGLQFGRSGVYDVNKILRTTEEYPPVTSTTTFSAAVAVPVTTSIAQIGNGWAAYPYGYRAVYVKRTVASGTGAYPMTLYLYSSDDNVSYYPVVTGSAFTSTVLSDTTKCDTLQVLLPSNATWEQVIPLPVDTYFGKYLAIFARRENTISQLLTIVWLGRQR